MMSRSRTSLVIALVLFSVGTLGFAWWQHAALARAQADLLEAQQWIVQLQRKPSLLPVPEMAMESSRSAVPHGDVPIGPAERELGDRRGGPGSGGRFGRAMLDLSSDPEIAPLLLNQRKRTVAARYAALLARLGLPPEQADRLKTLLAEKQLAGTDARVMARTQGLARDDVREMVQLADTESDAAIRSMLGETGFAQLLEYDRTYAQRTTVNSLADRLTYAGTPLPAAQQEQLIRILAANTPTASGAPGSASARGGSLEESLAYLEAKAASDAAALQQASAILTPAQLATLQQMQVEANEQLQLNALTAQRLRHLRGEASNNAPGR